MNSPTLFMVLLGCKPAGRNTEQHDIFFGIANHISELVEDMITFWPEAAGNIHLDAWRAVTSVGEYEINVEQNQQSQLESLHGDKLFFINLGGYKRDEFEEFHYKILIGCSDKGEAIRQAKQSAFYKHTGFEGASSHVDDKYGIDVDDLYKIADVLPHHTKEQYQLVLTKAKTPLVPDKIHLGYMKIDHL